MARVPTATYRLQFHAGFTFENARAIVAYLADLGITELYASPILKARKGSPHGYDVVDASALNPELGTEEDFTKLHDALREHNLGFLLDVVPNHMAASAENAWWMSVLESGPSSRYLPYFDIDWSPVTVQGKTVSKVLLPILGKPYGEALEAGEIQLRFEGESLALFYFEHRLPLAPESYRLVLRECLESSAGEGLVGELAELLKNETITNSKFLKETLRRTHDEDAAFRECLERAVTRINETPDDLDRLLDAQWYRLAYWRIASEKINYRRFFDVTDLVGVKVEDLEVFVARNQKTLDLVAEGKVTGLRIDHIDGLHDPLGHLKKLQLRLGDPFYVVVEKILEHGETLPRELPVAGTTGYDFLDTVNALFVDPQGLGKLTELYRAFTGITDSFEDIVYERKKQVINELFAGEMRALGKQLSSLAMLDRNARDFAPSELLAALTEITACMGVYRTYIRDSSSSEEDRRRIRDAVRCARERASSMDERLFTVLERMLLVEPPPYIASESQNWLELVMRWQQFTGRVMAKGVEDTAF
ncbi:MAG: malto-oligosyltrehalose synthase, partial [Acidobacteria bacterium]|nr:malto-oligosyltrehalose synthase [Acidobacteriota bacterium]